MDLIHQNGERLFVTSLEISNRFGKQHRDVLRAVENLECSQEFRQRNFAQSSYHNRQNKPQPAYEITRDGFTFLCMGFTGAQAALWKERYIEAFNRMESALRSTALTRLPDPALAQENHQLKARLADLDKRYFSLNDAFDAVMRQSLRAERTENRLLKRIITLQDRQYRAQVVAEKREARETIIALEREGVPRDIIAVRTGRTMNHIRQVIWQAKQAGFMGGAAQGDLLAGGAA